MNVFSILEKPRAPIALTEHNYNKKTSRAKPYVWNTGNEVKSYALCPACVNPVLLVNRHVAKTDAKILYAKHAGRSIPGLAEHDQQAYESCPFHNPERFDSKTRRTDQVRNDEIREALINHIHLVIKTLETATGITYSDELVEGMLRDFGANQGHQYKAISLYNLPFGFAYMTEAQDMYGLKVDNDLAEQITENSVGFEVGTYRKVIRKKGTKGTSLRLYFNNHRLGESSIGDDSIDLVVAEIHNATRTSTIVCSKTIEFNSEYFFNTYMRRERLRLLAQQYL
ncbi:TPA: hypothetical protein ACXNPF_004110 [Pseudomonas aeruginosa]|uniref:hypothetical protein n=1 Tax=Pseudomonas aeruginosa TaxID=287 RepID=UPI000A3FF631|nr:hypothetical protein [Pseudomonas aeruginosa]